MVRQDDGRPEEPHVARRGVPRHEHPATVGPAESVQGATATGTLAEYVSGAGGTGEVRVRVAWSTRTGAFVNQGDYLGVTYTA